MDPARFDRISKLFAEHRLSRRRALAGGAGLAAALGLVAPRRRAAETAAAGVCKTQDVWCANACHGHRALAGHPVARGVNFCWSWEHFHCVPCHHSWQQLAEACARVYPDYLRDWGALYPDTSDPRENFQCVHVKAGGPGHPVPTPPPGPTPTPIKVCPPDEPC